MSSPFDINITYMTEDELIKLYENLQNKTCLLDDPTFSQCELEKYNKLYNDVKKKLISFENK